MLGTATISYDLADMLGVDFDARRTKVWVTTNVPSETVVDTDANKIRLGSGNGTISEDGTGSVAVWTPGTGANPASWQTYIHVAYPDRNTPRGRAQRTFGPFTITASADLADLVDEQEVPPDFTGEALIAMQGYLAAAQDLTTQVTFASLARTPDALIAGAVTRNADGAATSAPVIWPDGQPGTYTATTLSTAFPGAVDAYTITYGAPVTKTYTQPAVTRGATGAATNVPAIVVS